jgi:hypothetical protein
MEAYLYKTIRSLKMILKPYVNGFLFQNLNFDKMHLIFEIVASYDTINNNVAKKGILELFPFLIWAFNSLIKKIKEA